jgi:flagellin
MLSVNSNSLASGIAYQLNHASRELDKSSLRIATGKRINSASDDPAGSAIVSKLKSHLSSYAVVERNIGSGNSLLEVAGTSLKEVQGILKNMRDLATQASDGNLTADQRTALNSTFAELQAQIDESVDGSTLFGQNLVSGAAATVDIQTGIMSGDKKTLSIAKSDGATLGVDSGTIDVTDTTKASAAITAIDTAIGTVSLNESVIGAQMNGLGARLKTVESLQVNLSKAVSRIEDIDISKETANLQLLQTKQQLNIAMLGSAAAYPQSALQLLR